MKGVLLKDLYIAGSNVVVTVIMLTVLGFGLSFLMEPSAILILAPGITTIPAFDCYLYYSWVIWGKGIIRYALFVWRNWNERYFSGRRFESPLCILFRCR